LLGLGEGDPTRVLGEMKAGISERRNRKKKGKKGEIFLRRDRNSRLSSFRKNTRGGKKGKKAKSNRQDGGEFAALLGAADPDNLGEVEAGKRYQCQKPGLLDRFLGEEKRAQTKRKKKSSSKTRSNLIFEAEEREEKMPAMRRKKGKAFGKLKSRD